VQVAHLELEARADPGQRRIGELDARLRCVRDVEIKTLEVLVQRQRGQYAPANVPLQPVDVGFERACRGLYVARGDQLPLRIEGGVHLRADARGRRDILRPLRLRARERLGREA